MQRVYQGRVKLRVSDFQYPRSDRRRCNRRAAVPLRRPDRPFSILGRIGGDATPPGPGAPPEGQHFQYPRSDRRRCNSHQPTCHHVPPLLSVSSVGSEAMQRKRRYAMCDGFHGLSVSSVGSEAMQLGDGEFENTLRLLFQYPRSDRRRCNHCDYHHVRRFWILSVSSVGSEAMQRSPSSGRETWNASFSILGRIGGDATPSRPFQWNSAQILSVSSVGSEAMQRCVSDICGASGRTLSVSSVGSEAMQRC